MYQATALETVNPPAMYQQPERPAIPYQQPYQSRNGPYPPRSQWDQRPQGAPRATGFPAGECGFCSATGHFLRECPVAGDFIRAGKCFRNQDNKLVLPNGQFVPRIIPGRNLAERIDRWLAENGQNNQQPQQQQQQPAQVQTQTFERDRPPHAVATMVFESRNPVQTMAFGQVPLPGKENKEETEAEVLVVEKRAKPKPRGIPEVVIQKSVAKPAAAEAVVAAKPAPKPLTTRPDVPKHPSQPAYRYQAPIEDPALVKAVIKRALEAQITITNEELCALSPDFRKYYRENTAGKRIPTVETSMVTVEGEEQQEALVLIWEGQEEKRGHLLTASPIDSLRVLDILVNDTHTVTCTLDQGSEIVAMNRNIWQELGVTLSPDKTLTMESADSNQSVTAGVIENLKFTVGDIDLLLQCHVVEGAPFDILMGRPFFRFTECHTKDRIDGAQELTITCPNTGKVLTVPTRQKTQKVNPEMNPYSVFEIGEVGFA